MASIIDRDRFRGREVASQGSGGDGGGTVVDDILRRLGVVESAVGEIRGDVHAIKAVLPHLATKAEVEALGARLNSVEGSLKTEIKSVEGSLKAEIRSVEGSLKADNNALRAELNARDTRNLVWLIGTVIAAASLAFSIARFVHVPDAAVGRGEVRAATR
jgi:hypothetical protein